MQEVHDLMRRFRVKTLSIPLGVLLLLGICSGCGKAVQNDTASTSGEEITAAETEQEEKSAQPEVAETKSDTLQFQLGSSSYAIDVPRSYRNGEVTMDELQSNQIAYYYSPDSEMDFDIYQFAKPDPRMSLKNFTNSSAEGFNGSEVRNQKINGIEVGSYKSREVYDGEEYDILVALMEEGDEYIEVVFWLDGENAEKEAWEILDTLSYVESFDLQLGDSLYYLTVPMGYQPGPITEEEAADDMVGYYYSDSSPLDFDVYQWGKDGYTLEKYAIEEANKYEAERVDYRTINGINLAFYYSYEESEGEMYTVANYMFENGDEFIEVSFWLDGEIAVKQTDRILSTLSRKDS